MATGVELADGEIVTAGVALGGVAARPWRVAAAERHLIGRPPTEEVFREAAAELVAGAQPLTQNFFKVDLVRNSVVRAVAAGVRQARGHARVMTVSSLMASVLNWLRAGYPDGVPGPDRVSLFALLRNTMLTEDEIKEIVRTIAEA